MEKLLLDILAANRAFDLSLLTGAPIDRLAAQVVGAVLTETNAAKRTAALNGLADRIIEHFATVAQPAARRLSVANARRIIDVLPAELRAAGVDDAALRRRVLTEGNLRPQTRVEIVRHLVKDRANTLDNRLAAYWLEPGPSARAKAKYLTDLHTSQQAAAGAYADAMAAFRKGDGPRPRKPELSYMARFAADVKQDVREQARRAGAEAETQEFTRRGFQVLAWITVQAGEACPQCRQRQGETGNSAYWDQRGRPGAGKTYCGQSCFCLLVPKQVLTATPSLKTGLNTPVKE